MEYKPNYWTDKKKILKFWAKVQEEWPLESYVLLCVVDRGQVMWPRKIALIIAPVLNVFDWFVFVVSIVSFSDSFSSLLCYNGIYLWIKGPLGMCKNLYQPLWWLTLCFIVHFIASFSPNLFLFILLLLLLLFFP